MVNMSETEQLLRDYVQNGAERAFRELVSRYTDLVYSTARRVSVGHAHLAEDVAQTVFIDLARSARSFSPQILLGGWLHRHTCFVAQKALRTELRRQARERIATEMSLLNEPEKHAGFGEAAAVVDEAINELKDEDRTAILLRFFERHDFRRVGEALGTTEDTAQKRVSRALEKLHGILRQRSITAHVSAAALGAALTVEAVTAAPSGLAATLAGMALTSATAATTLPISFTTKLALMTKLKAASLSALLIGAVATPAVIHHRAQVQIRESEEQLVALKRQLAASTVENERLASQVASGTNEQSPAPAPSAELLRLRGEVSALKRQLAEGQKVSPNRRVVSQPAAADQAAEDQKRAEDEKKMVEQAVLYRLNAPKAWMLAFLLYADQNHGQFPETFDAAAAFFPKEFTNSMNAASPELEIMYHGPINAITSPARQIVLREKDATAVPEGGWVRAYGFADGHSELHRSDDGNFDTWEARLRGE